MENWWHILKSMVHHNSSSRSIPRISHYDHQHYNYGLNPYLLQDWLIRYFLFHIIQWYDIHRLVDGVFYLQQPIQVSIFGRRKPWIFEQRRSIQHWKNQSCSYLIHWWNAHHEEYIAVFGSILLFPQTEELLNLIKTLPCTYSTKKGGGGGWVQNTFVYFT